MQKEADYLKEWFMRFLKNRDLAFRRIKEIKEDNDLIKVTDTKDQITIYKVIPFIDDFQTLATDESIQGIITYNTLPAYQSLKKAWNSLITHPNLVIYFINPFSKTEKKWIIRPRSHHFISDKDSLLTGLDSMCSIVEPCKEKEIKKITA